MLYQRYFLRMNQSNTAHIVSLLFGLVICLATVHIVFSIILNGTTPAAYNSIDTKNLNLEQNKINYSSTLLNFDTNDSIITKQGIELDAEDLQNFNNHINIFKQK